jgi:hypothetical protein
MPYRRFGTPYRSHLQGRFEPWRWRRYVNLKMGSTDSPETSASNYHYKLLNIPEDRRSQHFSTCDEPYICLTTIKLILYSTVCLRRRSSAARLLRLWVRIPPGPWMFVCCQCCVLSGRGLCDGLITRPEESYWLWRVVVCHQETSKTRRLNKARYRAVKIQPQWVVTPGKQTNKQTNPTLWEK